jgi:hypothetical protein
MAKWVYCSVNVSGEVKFYTRNGLNQADYSGGMKLNEDKQAHAIAKLGEEGWEAYAVCGNGVSTWFKRLKQL